MVEHNPRSIQNIIIVGGGTAGWLSAAYLNRALNGNSRERACNITLIESSDIGTVGVGEATLPSLQSTLRFLGISESEFMAECNATFKMAIKFENWSGLPGEDVFWHPFSRFSFSATLTEGIQLPLFQYWLKRKLEGDCQPFEHTCFEAVTLCEAGKSPKAIGDPEYLGRVIYAYHIDAGLFANFLRKKTISGGVNHIVDRVLEVVLDERGFIDYLITPNHGHLQADLFIDCSGFRGLLINQALQEPFISFSDNLLCDSAIALSVPYDRADRYNQKNGGINPYTTATAMSAGWVWNTPLANRSGNGYVFSSQFISPENAELEFREHLGRSSYPSETRQIKMRVGRTRNAWVKNCVSIGLASGFIEPLESTGIHLIEIGLGNLVNYFPDRSFPDFFLKKYNDEMKNSYERLRDFIVSHYCLTKKENTPFWRANKYDLKISDSLKEALEEFRLTGLSLSHIDEQVRKFTGDNLFAEASYRCIYTGMGYLPERCLPLVSYQDDSSKEQIFSEIERQARELEQVLPPHWEYLTKQYNQYQTKFLLQGWR